jgi:hypothetical protein
MAVSTAVTIEVEGPTCYVCKGTHSVVVKEKDLKKYRSGKGLIQECFPYLPKDEREILLSGIGSECWTTAFGSDEEE